MPKQINLKIVKNALDAENASYMLKCSAVLAWEGAEFSDGLEATEEILQKLADSVDFEKYKPSLLIDHDWSAEKIIGVMTAIKYENGELKADFDVMSERAGEKIAKGEWSNISLTFEKSENDDYFKVLECSIVAIPAIFGAKIEAKESENAEDKPEEAEKTDETEIVETVEKTEEITEEAGETANECDRIRDGAAVVENARLKDEITVLNAKIKRLEKAAETREKEIVVNSLLNKWQAEGKTAPAVAATEKGLLMSLNTKQLEAYKIVKNDIPAKIFGRLSSAPEQGAKSADEARFARMKADYEAKIGGKK